MPNAEKIEKVAALKERIEGADALLLAEYRGLSVHDATELRRSLSEQARFAIVKNTLFQRAAADAGVAELEALLDGPTAVAFVQGDVVATAKKVVDAAKRFPALVLKGGYLDGKVLSAAEAQALATLESREVMLSKVAGLMKAEMARAASMFQAIQGRFLGVLESYKAKLPGEDAEPTADASVEPSTEESPETASEAGNEPGSGSAEAPDEASGTGGRSRRKTKSPGRADEEPQEEPRKSHRKRRSEVMAKTKMTADDLLDQFKDMTLLELSDFVKKFEETFDVQAAMAAPMMVAAPGGVGGAGEEAEEQTEFDVVLTGAGDKKIQVIKEVRALTSLGLKEAKDLVDSAPKPVLEKVNKEAADKAKEQLEGVGAAVEVK